MKSVIRKIFNPFSIAAFPSSTIPKSKNGVLTYFLKGLVLELRSEVKKTSRQISRQVCDHPFDQWWRLDFRRSCWLKLSTSAAVYQFKFFILYIGPSITCSIINPTNAYTSTLLPYF